MCSRFFCGQCGFRLVCKLIHGAAFHSYGFAVSCLCLHFHGVFACLKGEEGFFWLKAYGDGGRLCYSKRIFRVCACFGDGCSVKRPTLYTVTSGRRCGKGYGFAVLNGITRIDFTSVDRCFKRAFGAVYVEGYGVFVYLPLCRVFRIYGGEC